MLVLPLHATHSLVSHPITVFEVDYVRDIEGQATGSPGPDFTIIGNLQPAGYKLLQLLPEGAQTDGAKVLHTTAPVYVSDNGQGRQTYIRHGGDVWKVHAVENWTPHSPIGRWLATRHLNIDTP